jgi:FtsP/CotA-like multicopper oxidase with cupredoxin domain
MVGITLMARRNFLVDRREVLAGFGAMASFSCLPGFAVADEQQRFAWQAKKTAFGWPLPARLSLGWSSAFTPVWSLESLQPMPRFRQGQLDVAFQNDLPAPAALTWRGLDGVAAAEPLLAREAVGTGGREMLQLSLRHAGTMFCSLDLLGDGLAQPSRGLPVIVNESEPVIVDRDEIFLIEEWRVRADGTAIGPGNDPKDTEMFHTINGIFLSDLLVPVRANQRLRCRFINASHRTPVAVKLENLDVRVMAIDSQPAEPFSARNGALVMAPGSRVDAFVDVIGPPGQPFSLLLHDGKQAHRVADFVISNEPPIRAAPLPAAPPLPSNGLPVRLDLKGALRVDLPLGGGDWVAPANFVASSAPTFHVRAGRTVVLALTNRAATATVFHLHGHHFRLLDRLDDGWKPYWLDTLAIEPGQTERIAFAAEYEGRWLLESAGTDWAAPKLVRWYSVD